MSTHLDSIPLSGITRIRDLMYSIENPFRLDQGDPSFNAPESVRNAIVDAVAKGHTHYLQTNGLPAVRELLARKLRHNNRIPVDNPGELLITNGGIHGLYLLCQALLEPGDEVLVPDPEWPPALTNVLMARGVPVRYPLYESRDWRFDPAELAAAITPRTRVIYLNSPNNPTGGVLTRADLELVAALARDRNLWVISDEAYEDILFDDAEHVSIGSLPGMYSRTLSVFTFSKSYAMTGLRFGYLAVQDKLLMERLTKVAFVTASNVSSIVQYGAIGGLLGSQAVVEQFRVELEARRDLFYEGIKTAASGVLGGKRPVGAFYAFLKIEDGFDKKGGRLEAEGGSAAGEGQRGAGGGGEHGDSPSWAIVERLIKEARVGCVPGVDFGRCGEGYVRFCFARERAELLGALAAMKPLFERR
ncbi:MAG: pyridoxal phosphate-dependent aminotransferase [Bacteroidales bacterium]